MVSECPPQFAGMCIKNGTEVLQRLSYRTHSGDELYDYIGLITLGVIMHIFAFLGIRRNIRSVGYY